ncbi:MAG: glutathione S-transferase family protein [Terricaulis sp.]
MLTIFHTPPTRSVRVVWLAEELGIPYETIPVSFGGPAPEGFKAISPLGQLPAIRYGDVAMVESLAIMQFLMARHGPTPLTVGADEADFPAYLQFLEFGEAGLCAMGNALVATKFRAPPEAQQSWTADYIVSQLRKRMGVVEQRLEGRDYIAADRFTAADISVGYGVGVAQYFGIAEMTPRIEAYHKRITSRPGYVKAAA